MGGVVSTREPSHVQVQILHANNEPDSQAGTIYDIGAVIGYESKSWQENTEGKKSPVDILDEFEQTNGLSLSRIMLNDRTGSFVVIAKCASASAAGSKNQFYAIPRLEPFSRISGICKIIGDRSSHSSEKYALEVGDMFRVGSVGLVVTQICLSSTMIESIQEEQMTLLKYQVSDAVFDDGDYGEATEDARPSRKSVDGRLTASMTKSMDMEAMAKTHGNQSTESGSVGSEDEDYESLCYICCDPETTAANPLLAACQCKGGTKWIHLNCFEQMLTSQTENRSCVVLTGDKELVCKVCRTPYRKFCQLESGKVIRIPQPHLKPPYICCKVVTHNAHDDSQSSLFNATYQISAANHMVNKSTSQPLYLGRSSECDVELNYQTVSARHATVTFFNNKFYIEDIGSSNGTFVYLREPLHLPANAATRIRMGRMTLKLSVALQSNGQKKRGGRSASVATESGSTQLVPGLEQLRSVMFTDSKSIQMSKHGHGEGPSSKKRKSAGNRKTSESKPPHNNDPAQLLRREARVDPDASAMSVEPRPQDGDDVPEQSEHFSESKDTEIVEQTSMSVIPQNLASSVHNPELGVSSDEPSFSLLADPEPS